MAYLPPHQCWSFSAAIHSWSVTGGLVQYMCWDMPPSAGWWISHDFIVQHGEATFVKTHNIISGERFITGTVKSQILDLILEA